MWLSVAIGGVAGTLARYALGGWIQIKAGSGFPTGTLVINVLGSFALGVLMRFGAGTTALSPQLRAGLTIGFCGAFTTMSTFSYETMSLLGDGQYLRAVAYLGGTLAGCLAAVMAGMGLAERLL